MKHKNTFQQGIPAEERDSVVPLEGGLSVHQGVPKITEEYLAAQGEWRGVAMPGPGMMPEETDLPALRCAATTKKGNPCKGYAVSNSVHCVGHNK